MKDFQYFKPLVADVRTSQNHVRIYLDDAVPFSNSNKDGAHLFFDASFGEFFPLLGVTLESQEAATPAPLHTPGVTLFADGAAHLLLDWNTASRDVINTDYRIGLGIATRLPRFRFLALRYRFYHESTHLGDEYTLFASLQPAFRRYNVSDEAHELYVAVDRHLPAPSGREGVFTRGLSYARAYGGGRWLNRDSYDGFTGLFEQAEPILARRDEFQVGGEIYLRAWPGPDERPAARWLSRLLAFQTLVIAADFNRLTKYGVTAPRLTWSANVVIGIVYGEKFGASGQRTTRWELNYFSGINPHGQFRSTRISYVGLNFVLDF